MCKRILGGLARRIAPAFALAAALGGCAVYHALPLPARDDLAGSATPAGAPPLDMNEAATLAVLNNPDLRAARARLGVAAAQAFAAGILPDPQFSYSHDHPTDRVGPADYRYPLFDAYGYGLQVDLQALLTYGSRRTAARAAFDQAKDDLLWQEWQTVAQARSVYAAWALAQRREAYLDPAVHAYALAARNSEAALAAGNLTRDQASADLDLLNTVRAQQGAARRGALQAGAALHALLGVRPDVAMALGGLGELLPPSRASVAAALAKLADTRPDLRALRSGYRSEEAQLRVAILSQFPNIVVGFARARDTSNVHTSGVSASLTLPIFDRGRGGIAIQRATRAQLRAEYQARLDQAVSDSWALWSEMQELAAEIADMDRRLPALRTNSESAAQAFRAANLPVASYIASVGVYLAAQSSRLDLLQNLWSDSIALAAVTGTQIQPVDGK